MVLDGALSPALFEPLVSELQRRGDELPILAIESPHGTALRPGAPAPRLTASDRDEAQRRARGGDGDGATRRRAARAVRGRAARRRRAGGGGVGGRARSLPARRARRRHGAGAAAARDHAAERALDVARRALERLAREAERAGAVLLVRNGRRYVDLPSPRELDRLRAELSGAPLLPAADLPAAHLADVMGFAPMALTLAAFADAPLWYWGDACGPVGALAPGRGIVDLAAARASVKEHARLAFSPWVRPRRRRGRRVDGPLLVRVSSRSTDRRVGGAVG